jgi:hypothetical protein
VKAWMELAKLTTTRYLHAKPRHTDVARLDRPLAAGATLTQADRTPDSLAGSPPAAS